MTDPQLYTTNQLFEKTKTLIKGIVSESFAKKALDVPAGGGALTKFMREDLGLQVEASDIDGKKWQYTQVNLKPADLGDKLPYSDASFDLVVCLEGLKHVFNCSKAVSELARVCRPGGSVVITIPNDLCLQTKLRYFFDSQVDIDWGFIDLNSDLYKNHLYIGSTIQLPLLHHFMEKSGLKLISTHTSKLRFWSVLLGVLFYPLIWWFTGRHYRAGHPLLSHLRSFTWLAGRRNIVVCTKL
ncbi:MAG: class I SAM-dependent methyltransferase [Oligoflexia bacterium]|nr:class I SAM-dependent methyltransferase [Oligoflexia bacterium]